MSLVERITALTERIAAEFRNIQHSQLPSQTGNAGKFLGTDGTSVSWQDVPVTQAELDSIYETLTAELQVDEALEETGGSDEPGGTEGES